MSSPVWRPALGAIVGGMLLVAVAASATNAATRSVDVSPEIAQPGDKVTVAIHDYGGAWRGTDLYLIPTATGMDGQHCGDMVGAIKVAVITWTHDEPYHEGRAAFTLPIVPDGEYSLGEEVSFVTPPCAGAGSFTVGDTAGPDTAMQRPLTSGRWVIAGIILLLVAALLAWRGVRANRGPGEGRR